MIYLIFSCLIQLLFGLPQGEINISSEPILVSAEQVEASGPYFTKDEHGKPVLVWTEKLPGDEKAGYVMKFAKLSSNGSSFGAAIEVSSSRGCRSHSESMNKIAFKKDGTIVAVYSKRTPTKKNRFAGALYYTQSFDGGKSWSGPKYLHVGNTNMGLSRSFFDIATLGDGEVGAIWLDSRLTKKRGEGSSLFFSKTSGKKGFLVDQVIGRTTCECCRTDLFVGSNGDIHAAYRDIWQDSIRDMSIIVSKDNGRNFSDPKKLYEDNWVINGCPHTGPSLGETDSGLHCIWYTMGGGSGLYYTNSDQALKFKKKRLVSNSGSHPQMITMTNGSVIFVFEESSSAVSIHNHASGGHHKKVDSSSGSSQVIKAQVWKDGNPASEFWISGHTEYAQFPVLTDLGKGFVGIAWVQDISNGKTGVYFKKMKIGI